MYFENSDELNRYIAEKSGGRSVLAFSCGKDSIAAWIVMQKYFPTILPVYMYLVPDLSFVDDALDYYENFFKTRIIRLPHPSLYRMINNLVFQAPENCASIEKMGLPNFDYDTVHLIVKEDFGLPVDTTYTASGVRARDSLNRWASIKKYGPVNENRKSFYPIFDYDKKQMVKTLDDAKVKLPVDYQLFGRSFDGLDYRFTLPIREKFPKDYEKIKAFFPLVDIDEFRINCRKAYYERTETKDGN